MRQKRPPTGLWIGFSVSVTLLVFFIIAANTRGAPSSSSTPTPTDQVIQQSIATTQPTPRPTDTPVPTPTPHLVVQPTHAPPPPPTPVPTKPACQAVNNNPWCYNFSPGKLIYYPPSGFCSYFNCIATFVEPDDPGDGYVVQCVDGLFSQSGSERGACSYHGGVARPLYSH